MELNEENERAARLERMAADLRITGNAMIAAVARVDLPELSLRGFLLNSISLFAMGAVTEKPRFVSLNLLNGGV